MYSEQNIFPQLSKIYFPNTDSYEHIFIYLSIGNYSNQIYFPKTDSYEHIYIYIYAYLLQSSPTQSSMYH